MPWRRVFPTDLLDLEGVIASLIPQVKTGGRAVLHERREILGMRGISLATAFV
ncbi:hypothetical protein ABH917_001100 [Thermobifida halotolerans]